MIIDQLNRVRQRIDSYGNGDGTKAIDVVNDINRIVGDDNGNPCAEQEEVLAALDRWFGEGDGLPPLPLLKRVAELSRQKRTMS